MSLFIEHSEDKIMGWKIKQWLPWVKDGENRMGMTRKRQQGSSSWFCTLTVLVVSGEKKEKQHIQSHNTQFRKTAVSGLDPGGG